MGAPPARQGRMASGGRDDKLRVRKDGGGQWAGSTVVIGRGGGGGEELLREEDEGEDGPMLGWKFTSLRVFQKIERSSLVKTSLLLLIFFTLTTVASNARRLLCRRSHQKLP